MSKKKTIISSIGIGGTLAVLGLAMCGIKQIPEVGTSQTPIVENMNYGGTVKLASTSSMYSSATPIIATNGVFVSPQVNSTQLASSTFEYLGIKYAYTNGKLVASASANAATVEDIYLFQFAQGPSSKIETDYSAIDFTTYAQVQRVVLIGNNMCTKISNLKSIPKDFSLYVGGRLEFTEDMKASDCTYLYVYTPYDYVGNSLYNQTNLEGSNIMKIYTWSKGPFRYYSCSAKNAGGSMISVGTMANTEFDYEMFYPYTGYQMNNHYYGCSTYAYCNDASKDTLTEKDFYYKVKSVDTKLSTLVVTSRSKTGAEFALGTYRRLVVPNRLNDLSGFSNTDADELVIEGISSSSFSISSLSGIKNIRIVPSSTPVKVIQFGYNENYNANIEHIYLPEEYKEQYSMIATSGLASKVEYYKLSEYEMPTESLVLGYDGNEYKVDSTDYTPSNLYTYSKRYLTDGNKLDSTKALDTQLIEANINMTGIVQNHYALNDYDQIICYQDTDVAALIEAIKGRLVLNNGLCSSDTATLTTDLSHYMTDGYITVTAVFADGTTAIKDYMMPKFLGKGTAAYLIKNDVVTVVTGPSETFDHEATLKPVLNKFMEYDEFTVTPGDADTNGAGFINLGTYNATGEDESFYAYLTDADFIDETYIETNGYEVAEIDKIYCPSSLNAIYFINQATDALVTQYGLHGEDGIQFVVAHNKITNKEDYTFSMSHRFTSEYMFDADVNVHITNSSTKMGFIAMKDGSVVALYNHGSMTDTEVKDAISNFIKTELSIDSPDITYATNLNLNNTGLHSGSTYDGEKSLYIVSSGVKLDFTDPTTPIDESSLKVGYVAMDELLISKNYDMMDAIHAVGRYLLLKDGKKVEDYKIESSYTDKTITLKYLVGGKEVLSHTVNYKTVESDTPFIFARASRFHQGVILLEKQDEAPAYDLSTLMNTILRQADTTIMTTFTTESTIDFTKQGSETVKGTFELGNGQYYGYSYDVKIVDMDYEVRHTNTKIEGEPEQSFEDKTQTWLENFKEKLENNKALKALAITLGSILGLGIVYLLYKFIRKIIKWLK